MITDFSLRARLGVIILFPSLIGAALGQGALTPPGAPAPLFKTLQQVEPRIPISNFNTTITNSGSYYLVSNLLAGGNSFSNGITVLDTARHVTIDLNGFAIVTTNPPGTLPVPSGIRITGATNVTVRNGLINGFDYGVFAFGSFYGVVVENVHVLNSARSGIQGQGISGDASQTIVVRQCVVENIDAAGKGTNVSAGGITLINCTALVTDCVVRDIFPQGGNTGDAIVASTCTNTFVDHNFMSGAPYGLRVIGTGTNRVIFRNNLTVGCATNYNLSTGATDRGGNF